MARGSRRRFLTTSLAGFGLTAFGRPQAAGQGLGSLPALPGATEGPKPCKPDEKLTPAAPLGGQYRPNAPRRTSLLEPGLAGTTLLLTGTVAGLSCGPIKSAVLEFWQADASGLYDRSGFRLRGQQQTDANGRYRLETIVPGPSGSRAPRLHVRVRPPGKPPFVTELFFPDAPQNRTGPSFKPELAMKVAAEGATRTATFDIVLDL
jgi:protocatechuate 3,4-dioxygenase beta subunit